MDVKWIKLATRYYARPELILLRGEKNGDKMLLIWTMLVSLAGQCNQRGRLVLENGMPYNLKSLSLELGFSEKLLEQAFEQLVRFNLIDFADETYSLKNWEEEQNAEALEIIRERERLKKRKQRARKKEDMSGTNRGCPDIEEEGEEDKEKEIEYSFNQSRKSSVDFDENVEKSVENQRQYLRGTLGQGVVMLSNEQFDDLLERLSLEEFEKYVGIVRDQELSGKHYRKKTHYQAIIDMATQDRRLA